MHFSTSHLSPTHYNLQMQFLHQREAIHMFPLIILHTALSGTRQLTPPLFFHPSPNSLSFKRLSIFPLQNHNPFSHNSINGPTPHSLHLSSPSPFPPLFHTNRSCEYNESLSTTSEIPTNRLHQC